MNNYRIIQSIFLTIVSNILWGCSNDNFSNCQLPCQLGINQTDEGLTVASFMNILVARGWINEESVSSLTATYAPDDFSAVLETKSEIHLDENAPDQYQPSIILDIGYIGGMNPDFAGIPSELIKSIRIESDLTVLQAILHYGLPQGGQVFPVYTSKDLEPYNPCFGSSLYIAYYNNGRTIIRTYVNPPILLNLWTSSVQIMYPIGRNYETERAFWIGKYERMNHSPCSR